MKWCISGKCQTLPSVVLFQSRTTRATVIQTMNELWSAFCTSLLMYRKSVLFICKNCLSDGWVPVNTSTKNIKDFTWCSANTLSIKFYNLLPALRPSFNCHKAVRSRFSVKLYMFKMLIIHNSPCCINLIFLLYSLLILK